MMLLRVPGLFLCFALSTAAGAQMVYNSSGASDRRARKEEHHGFDKTKLVFGGAPEIAFGSGGLALGVAPVLGYRFTERFLAGIGLSYTYYRQNGILSTAQTTYDFKAHAYAASIWARYLVFENFSRR